MAVFGLVFLLVVQFFLLVSGDWNEGICFSQSCWTVDGEQGCKRLSSQSISASECCEQASSAGFYNHTKLKKIHHGCYKCYTCQEILSKIDGGWSRWSQWGKCSEDCSGGIQTRERRCDSPKPSVLGKQCEGANEETRDCNTHPCPIHGGWGRWGPWSSCSRTCGKGVQKRYRRCNNPEPQFGGKDCAGSRTDTRDCVIMPNCPVDGKWSPWTPWSECSVSCGGGIKFRRRSCDSPAPKYGGKQCEGQTRVTERCNLQPCPIHGGWTEWSDWGPCIYLDCSKPEKGGRQVRSRSCTNPRPMYGGKMCEGSLFNAGVCVEKDNCKVDGGWSEWSSWKCSDFSANRVRYCNNPEPQFGGAACVGSDADEITADDLNKFCRLCNEACNKVNGQWELKPEGEEPDVTTVSEVYPTEDGSGSGFKDQESGEE